jgi:predicted ATPase
VQGPEFDSAVIARVLGREAADVEERLEILDRVHYMVRLVREQTFPDGTLTLRYGFVHVLYQNALYAALQPTRKASWSAAAAHALLKHYGDESTGSAAELAMLFEAARDPERAADHYLAAAENAARMFAHHEAVALARRGLALLEALPESADRTRRELPLLVTLGIQLQVVRGYAAPEAERTYDRARALCERTRDAPQLFPVLWGLWMVYEVRSDLAKSRDLAERLLAQARQTDDRSQLLQGHMALTVTSFSLGDLVATREHSERGVALYDPAVHGHHAHLYGQDPKMSSLAFGAVALWMLGHPDLAVARSREALALGARSGHPTSRALALYFAAMLRQYRREPPAVLENAEAMTAIGAEHGLSLWLANGRVMRGWALAEQGSWAEGIALLRQGLADWAATGAGTHRTYFLGLLAEALGRAGQIGDALAVIDQALALTESTGTVFHAAELHRLRGEFLLRRPAAEIDHGEAEASIRRALAVARKKQAKSLELRAAMSLTRLLRKLDRRDEARRILAECYQPMSEGHDSPDLRDARLLLDEMT